MYYQTGGGWIPILFFADDTMIFTRLSRHGLEKLKGFLDRYQQVSRQRINVSKSAFLCSHTTPALNIHLVQSILSLSREQFPIRYFGTPVFTGHLRRVLFEGILDKICSRIQG